MKLVVPYIGTLNDADARLVRLAEFLGISCEALALDTVVEPSVFLEKMVSDRGSCFVVNPRVMQEWVGHDGVPAGLVNLLLSRFSRLLVHSLRVDAFDSELVAAVSGGRLQSVDGIREASSVYAIRENAKHICESFSGLSFGPANLANDHVMSPRGSDGAVQELISIGGRPFMALVKTEHSEIVFVASESVADLDDEVGDKPLVEYFSRFVPHAMALRYVAGIEAWRPYRAYGSIIIDDPLLRTRYGFLNFDALLSLAKQYNFHASIAFIPHNFRRNSERITRMFRDNAARLSICFHGNDHTGGEFATTDKTLLNNMLYVAEQRMRVHFQLTKLSCGRVMVFPQGKFSVEAMNVLKLHDFDAAVNTAGQPVQSAIRLAIRELAQPAVLRYGGFPLFLRKPIQEIQRHDIAFNVFFGRPILIVEHHDIFRRPAALGEAASMINSVAPHIVWSDIATVVESSTLRRTAANGKHQIRAYSGTVRISNDSDSSEHCSIEWPRCDGASVEQVLVEGAPDYAFEVDETGIRLPVQVAAGKSQMVSLVHRNVYGAGRNLGFRWSAKAFVRRRLSEGRDNYLSKSQPLLGAANSLKRMLLN